MMPKCAAGIAQWVCGASRLAHQPEPESKAQSGSRRSNKRATSGWPSLRGALFRRGDDQKENVIVNDSLQELLELPPDLSFAADEDHAPSGVTPPRHPRRSSGSSTTPPTRRSSREALQYPELAFLWDAGRSAGDSMQKLSGLSVDDVVTFANKEILGLLDYNRFAILETLSDLGSDVLDVFGLSSGSASTSKGVASPGMAPTDGFAFVDRLQDRKDEVALLADGRLQLPLLAPPPESQASGHIPDMRFDSWMQGGPGMRVQLPPQSFFFDYDSADMSISACGKTYGPQRMPGDPYTMRPFLTVLQRKEDSAWIPEDFLANYEVRYWDYELGYVTKERKDACVVIAPRYLGVGPKGEYRYSFNWMQSLHMEVTLQAACAGPLMLVRFGGEEVQPPVPLFRLRSGYDQKSSRWYLAPFPPAGHPPVKPLLFTIGFSNSMRMLSAYLHCW